MRDGWVIDERSSERAASKKLMHACHNHNTADKHTLPRNLTWFKGLWAIAMLNIYLPSRYASKRSQAYGPRTDDAEEGNGE